MHISQLVSKRLLLIGLCLLALSPVASMGQTQKRDWALYKTIYVNGTAFFAPIVGIGGVPVALGFSHQSSTPIINMYVDKNSYRRDGDIISFDLVWHAATSEKSILNAGMSIDCATRTFFQPTAQMFDGPMATGTPGKVRTRMKKPKVSGDFKAQDMAYFCEGPSPSPIPVTTSP